MRVGNRVFSGKGAREEGAAALTQAVLSWRDDLTLQVRGAFRGFEILSRGNLSIQSVPQGLSITKRQEPSA
ncbi:MAG: Helicase domain protein, partial [Acidobacteria bacterium]|nr:Helicase domain protein [Acidobacteriota bacterium]